MSRLDVSKKLITKIYRSQKCLRMQEILEYHTFLNSTVFCPGIFYPVTTGFLIYTF